jgi:hypothetical protein
MQGLVFDVVKRLFGFCLTADKKRGKAYFVVVNLVCCSCGNE